jgi:hypothetical protein
MDKPTAIGEMSERLDRSPYEVERMVWPLVVEFGAEWIRRYVTNGEKWAEFWVQDVGAAVEVE